MRTNKKVSKQVGLLGTAFVLIASTVVSIIVQSRVLALPASNIDYQRHAISLGSQDELAVHDSAISGNGDVYEVGVFENDADFNPTAAVDKKSSPDTDSGYIRISGADGAYKRTLVIQGEMVSEEYEGEAYEWMDGGLEDDLVALAFSPDKSTYYIAGNFWGTVDFDTGAGEVLRTADSEAGDIGFIAAYSTVDDSLQKVSVIPGVEINGLAVNPVSGRVAMTIRLSDESGSVDLNPDAGLDMRTATATEAGVVSFYDGNLGYEYSYVYDNGDSRMVFMVDAITYDASGRLLFALHLTPAGGGSGFDGTVDFNPDGETNDDYAYDFPSYAMPVQAIVIIAADGLYEKTWVVQAEATSSNIGVKDIVVDNTGTQYFMGYIYGQFDVNPVGGDGEVDSRTFARQVGYVAKIDAEGEFVDFKTTTSSTSAYMFYSRGVTDSDNNLYLSGPLINYDSEGGVVGYDLDPTAGDDTYNFDYSSRVFLTRFNAEGNYDYTIVSHPGASEEYMSMAIDGQDRPYVSVNTISGINTQDDEDCSLNPEDYQGMALTRFSAAGTVNSNNWLEFDTSPAVYVDGCDADEDSVSDADEGNIVGGDANGDEEQDSQQDHVAALTNPVSDNPVALEVDSTCALSNVSVKTEAQTGDDDAYAYPLGLLDFTASCGTNGFTSTIKQIYYDPPAGDFVLRKFANGIYQTITDATITRTTLNGQNVLIVTYDVQDGGPLDADGEANGVIVDPAGLALTSMTIPGVPNTGVGPILSRVVSSTAPAVAVTVVLAAGCFVTVGSLRRTLKR